jgi:hypothetical protein
MGREDGSLLEPGERWILVEMDQKKEKKKEKKKKGEGARDVESQLPRLPVLHHVLERV